MKEENMENYHSHKWYTNAVQRDCGASYEEYIERALELNQTVITSVEHGYQGNYWYLNELIELKNKELQERRDKGEENVPRDLVFVFGAEAYWVKDRHEKDRSNCHIILLAKNENGRKKINLALSKANEDGMFGGKPRLDLELLLELPKDDVFVTSSCLAYWNKYEDIEDITLQLHNYFGDNFMLEVQYHNTEEQKKLNKRIIQLSRKHNIGIIAGLDSHYIHKDNGEEIRNRLLEDQGIFYDDEEGWYLDYPSYSETFRRFEEQGVLTKKEIHTALQNTNIVSTFGNYDMNRNIKLPTLFEDKTQAEKDKLFKNIINKEWKIFREKENIPKEEYPMYLDGIRYEVGEVVKTGMSDYFLDHYYALKLGVEKYGGHITKRGRGSAVGFFINTLLGFSKVDRFKAPIKIYPERFLTSDRILLSKSLPDIDNNIDRQEPFVQAFRELMGEHSIYPMLAFGTLQKSSAIKMYMRTMNIDAQIQNKVTEQLKKYEKDLKHCETDEEREELDITKYIDKEYIKYIELSKDFQGMVVSKSQHPCAFLLLNGDIREEIGLLRCESKSKGTSILTACIEGVMADHYKFLKTDLLIVDVVGLTEAIWKRISKPSPSNTQLEKWLAEPNCKAWDMYAKGYTLCVNQCEKEGTKNKCMRYKMKNTGELSSLVAAVRPGFSSLLNDYLDRKPYTTHVPQLDEVLKDSYHYMLYQESIMAFLNWLGIDMKETYDIVKKISKKVFQKHPEQMIELKNKCRQMWIKNTGSEDYFDETFETMENAGNYCFNAAHSYCVGNDGAEIAYTKAYYPYETYETCLNWFSKKKNKDKVAALKKEMKDAFDINVGDMKWGKDNRQFTLDKENKCIYPDLTGIKKLGKNIANELYEASKNQNIKTFYDLMVYFFPPKDNNLTEEAFINKLGKKDESTTIKKLKNNKIHIYVLDDKEHIRDILNILFKRELTPEEANEVIEIKPQEFFEKKTTLNNAMLDILIGLDYFDIFGRSQKLLDFVKYYNLLSGKKSPKKSTIEKEIDDVNVIKIIEDNSNPTDATYSNLNYEKALLDIWDYLPNKDIPITNKIKYQKDYLGNIDYTDNSMDNNIFYVESITRTQKYSRINLYRLKTGKIQEVKIWNSILDKAKISLLEGKIVYLRKHDIKIENQKEPSDEINPKTGKRIWKPIPDKYEFWLLSWQDITYEFEDEE